MTTELNGATNYEEARLLATSLPQGTDVYIGLFTTMPDADGSNGVEASGSSYARVAHQDWISSVRESDDTSHTERRNNGDIEFPTLTGNLDGVVGWGAWDASSGGNLRWGAAFPNERDFVTTEQPRISHLRLVASLSSPSASTLEGQFMIDETIETSDGSTETLGILASLDDLEAAHVDVVITGRTTAGEHYFREWVASYYRDDGGAGMTLWKDRRFTSDADTRVGFTTALGEVVDSGNDVIAQVTGEAGKAITWRVTGTVRLVED